MTAVQMIHGKSFFAADWAPVARGNTQIAPPAVRPQKCSSEDAFCPAETLAPAAPAPTVPGLKPESPLVLPGGRAPALPNYHVAKWAKVAGVDAFSASLLWEAAFDALHYKEISPQDIDDRAPHAMQYVPALALLDVLATQWLSCGPGEPLRMPLTLFADADTLASLAPLHRDVTLAVCRDERVLGWLIRATRARLAGDAWAQAPAAVKPLSNDLYQAIMAALSSRRMQHARVLGSFWEQLTDCAGTCQLTRSAAPVSP